MNARDELADEIAGHPIGSGYYSTNVGIDEALEIADTLFAAGYRKPRTITTIEELDQAIEAAFEDDRHIIVSDNRRRPWIIWADEDGDEQVDSWPQEADPERLTLSDIALPANIVHEATR